MRILSKRCISQNFLIVGDTLSGKKEGKDV
jgi:hypothetical protein